MERETPKQRERRCAGRLLVDGVTYPCQRNGVILGPDGQWRCVGCGALYDCVREILARPKATP
jgi:hypothetical protein